MPDKIYVMKKDKQGKFTDEGYTINANLFYAFVDHYKTVLLLAFGIGVLVTTLINMI